MHFLPRPASFLSYTFQNDFGGGRGCPDSLEQGRRGVRTSFFRIQQRATVHSRDFHNDDWVYDGLVAHLRSRHWLFHHLHIANRSMVSLIASLASRPTLAIRYPMLSSCTVQTQAFLLQYSPSLCRFDNFAALGRLVICRAINTPRTRVWPCYVW